jgi:hypothetical protein
MSGITTGTHVVKRMALGIIFLLSIGSVYGHPGDRAKALD